MTRQESLPSEKAKSTVDNIEYTASGEASLLLVERLKRWRGGTLLVCIDGMKTLDRSDVDLSIW